MKRFALAFGLTAGSTPAPSPRSRPTKTAEKKVKAGLLPREEVVVVSASKTESTLINAPATISVIGADAIATSPSQNYGDLLRSTPGLNVIQTSARDINMTSRQSTSTLATSQLVMLDGRSIYLDFFGLVLWDFVPQSTSEIKQIEVVRGPASAVWGANALTGVVNIITKSPRDAEGFNLNLQGGLFNRSKGSREDDGSGYLYGANFSYAQAPSEKLAWRLSAGYFNSDPFSRPVGRIPLDCHPLGAIPCRDSAGKTLPGGIRWAAPSIRPIRTVEGASRTTAPPAQGRRAPRPGARHGRQRRSPHLPGRLLRHHRHHPHRHRALSDPERLVPGLRQGAVDAQCHEARRVRQLHGRQGPEPAAHRPRHRRPGVAELHDADLRRRVRELERDRRQEHPELRRQLPPEQLRHHPDPEREDRNEFGAYVQEEYFTEHFRISVGARVDKFGNLDDPVFSPRVSLMYKPGARHSIRLSFNRAFRSPSVVNDYLAQDIFAPTLSTSDAARRGGALPQAPHPRALLPAGQEQRQRGRHAPLSAQAGVARRLRAGLHGQRGQDHDGHRALPEQQDDNINFTQLTPTTRSPRACPG